MLSRIVFWLFSKFRDDRRGLFSFWDGTRYRSMDALVLARNLMSHEKFNWDDTPGLLRSGIATVQLAAFGLIAETVREVFRIPQVEFGGLTDLGCADLLASFQDHLGDVKKNTSLFPISQTSTEQEQSTIPLPPPLPLASGSTESVPLPENVGLPAVAISGDSAKPPAAP